MSKREPWEDALKALGEVIAGNSSLSSSEREFLSRVAKRLEDGHLKYASRALQYPTKRILTEALEECYDIGGWLAWLALRKGVDSDCLCGACVFAIGAMNEIQQMLDQDADQMLDQDADAEAGSPK